MDAFGPRAANFGIGKTLVVLRSPFNSGSDVVDVADVRSWYGKERPLADNDALDLLITPAGRAAKSDLYVLNIGKVSFSLDVQVELVELPSSRYKS